jgi:copper chaperone CopZ
MKYIALPALLLLLCSSIMHAQNKIETIAIKASIYCDHCKKCESCGERIEKTIFSIKGIKRVDIDEASKTVKVAYNTQKTDASRIREAIASAGFDADDIKADPVAYQKLDDCCKK